MTEFEKGKETWDMSDEEKLEFCGERKAVGSSLFKAGRLDLALGRYKKVGDVFSYIDNYSEDAKAKAKELKQACELNKAMCYLKIKDYVEAKAACSAVLRDDKGNVKALYRRAQCEYALNNFEECIRDCRSAAEVDPQNREVRALLKQALEGQKEVNRQAKGMYANMVKGLGKEQADEQVLRKPNGAAASKPSSTAGAEPQASGSAVQPYSFGRIVASLTAGLLGAGRGLLSLLGLGGLSRFFGPGAAGDGPAAAAGAPTGSPPPPRGAAGAPAQVDA